MDHAVSTTRGVSFLPQQRGDGFAAHKLKVQAETEAAYGEHLTGQARYERAQQKPGAKRAHRKQVKRMMGR